MGIIVGEFPEFVVTEQLSDEFTPAKAEFCGKGSTQDLMALACRYLVSHKWCERVERAWLSVDVAPFFIVAVLEFTMRTKARHRAWVVVGDLPPLHMDDTARTWGDALAVYVVLMELWVRRTARGRDVSDLPPVGAPPTDGNRDELSWRCEEIRKFLRDHGVEVPVVPEDA